MPHFFFSYARDDARDDGLDPRVYQFFDDLRNEVAIRGSIPKDVGFLDKNQTIGGEWAPLTSRALGTCKVFVPLYSPSYFRSSYCGQEWHAFAQRTSALPTEPEAPSCVVPVWWVPPIGGPPKVASKIQDTRDQFDPEYREYGLRYLIQVKDRESRYQEAVVKLANHIIGAVNSALPQHEDLDLNTVPNAFADVAIASAPGRPRRASDAVTGPRKVTFVVMAAGQEHMRDVRTVLESYGAGWEEWRPYHPVCSDPIALRAQGVAGHLRMLALPQAADEKLFTLIEQAQRASSPVVVLVDPWAAKLPAYRELLERLNTHQYINTAVVVPWETDVAPHDTLRDLLYLCLTNWMEAGVEVFRDDITSMEGFETTLHEVLIAVRRRIVKRATVARRVAEAGPHSVPVLSGSAG